MKKISVLILVLFAMIAAYGIYYFIQLRNDYSAPSFQKIENIQFKNLSLPPDFKVQLQAAIILDNPNRFGLEINTLAIDVYINDKKASHLTQPMLVKMPANDTFTLPLTIDIPLEEKDFIKNLSDLITGTWKKKSFELRLEGNIQLQAIKFKFDVPYQHKAKYQLKDFL